MAKKIAGRVGKKRGAATRRGAPSRSTMRALAGKGVRGQDWDPTKPQAMAAAAPELNKPRPSTERYPIPNEAFEALKKAAPKPSIRLSGARIHLKRKTR
jgi:hypothetical protein